MPDTTVLNISGNGVPPYSARGLTQTLEPIQSAASMRRTVNGALVDLSVAEMRKYASTITCTDMQTPAVSGIWPGALVTVDCVAELAHPTGGTPERTVVTGSLRTEDGFDFYRPQLSMRVVGWNISRDEYGASVGWQLALEEA